MLVRPTSAEELAASTGLTPAMTRRLIELGLLVPRAYYTQAELQELRCARRLIEDLAIGDEAVEVVLRLRRRVIALQREVVRLELELRGRPRREPGTSWANAEWTERSR
jgi:DNA-binding transcriptional MerR regulator